MRRFNRLMSFSYGKRAERGKSASTQRPKVASWLVLVIQPDDFSGGTRLMKTTLTFVLTHARCLWSGVFHHKTKCHLALTCEEMTQEVRRP